MNDELEERLREINERLRDINERVNTYALIVTRHIQSCNSTLLDASIIEDRFARIETKIDVFWDGLSMDFARMLRRGGDDPTRQSVPVEPLITQLDRVEQILTDIRRSLGGN